MVEAWWNPPPTLGVVCDARREVREGGRRGVVGREGMARSRLRERDGLRGRGLVVIVAMTVVVQRVVGSVLCGVDEVEEDVWMFLVEVERRGSMSRLAA